MGVFVVTSKQISAILKSSASSSFPINSSSNSQSAPSVSSHYNIYSSNFFYTYTKTSPISTTNSPLFHCSSSSRRFYGHVDDDDINNDSDEYISFKEAVELFNKMDYYKCHNYLEHLWNESPNDILRTLYHAILQCSVGFHHLFNYNHKGAMMELGEGLCKLRKLNFESGPFHQFELEISASLNFIYQTQLELAACSDDICLAMDQTERSYQLLGSYAAGQRLYCLESGPSHDETNYIVFCPEIRSGDHPRVKLPTLHATEEHLPAYHY